MSNRVIGTSPKFSVAVTIRDNVCKMPPSTRVLRVLQPSDSDQNETTGFRGTPAKIRNPTLESQIVWWVVRSGWFIARYLEAAGQTSHPSSVECSTPGSQCCKSKMTPASRVTPAAPAGGLETGPLTVTVSLGKVVLRPPALWWRESLEVFFF